jgi:predicted nucleic acid-binding Zn ribbon protein
VTRFRTAPRPLGIAVASLRDELAPATPLSEVQTVWPAVVGAAIAAEATPTAERGGVLTVSCSASVWAQELTLMAPQIIERLNGQISFTQIVRLRCVAV